MRHPWLIWPSVLALAACGGSTETGASGAGNGGNAGTGGSGGVAATGGGGVGAGGAGGSAGAPAAACSLAVNATGALPDLAPAMLSGPAVTATDKGFVIGYRD